MAEQSIPSLPPGSSQSDRLAAVAEQEWGSPRVELDLILEDAGQNQLSLGSISLLNRRPYYEFSLILYLGDGDTFLLKQGWKIKAKTVNIGNGNLSGSDSLTIWGYATSEEANVSSNGLSQSDINNAINLHLSNANHDAQVYPEHFSIFVEECRRIVNSFTLQILTSQMYNYYYNFDNAINTEFEFEALLSQGNYKLKILGAKSNNRGIATFRINGNPIGNIDLYDSSAIFNVVNEISFTANYSGIHTFNIKAESKNSNSSGYILSFTKFWSEKL